jgi:hypothetical protein
LGNWDIGLGISDWGLGISDWGFKNLFWFDARFWFFLEKSKTGICSFPISSPKNYFSLMPFF